MKRNISLIQVIGVYWTWYVMLLLANVAWALASGFIDVLPLPTWIAHRITSFGVILLAIDLIVWFFLDFITRYINNAEVTDAQVLDVSRMLRRMRCTYKVNGVDYRRWIALVGGQAGAWPQVGDTVKLLLYQKLPKDAVFYGLWIQRLERTRRRLRTTRKIDHEVMMPYALWCIVLCIWAVPNILYWNFNPILILVWGVMITSGILDQTRQVPDSVDLSNSTRIKGILQPAKVVRIYRLIRVLQYSYEWDGQTYNRITTYPRQSFFRRLIPGQSIFVDVVPLYPAQAVFVYQVQTSPDPSRPVTMERVIAAEPTMWFVVLAAIIMVVCGVLLLKFDNPALAAVSLMVMVAFLIVVVIRYVSLKEYFRACDVTDTRLESVKRYGPVCRITYRYNYGDETFTGQGWTPYLISECPITVDRILTLAVDPQRPQNALPVDAYYPEWDLAEEPPYIR